MKKIIPIILCLMLIFSSLALADTPAVTVNGDAALLIEKSTGKVLYEKNANKKEYPASLTKILTALIVLENCELTEQVTISNAAVLSVPAGSNIAYLKAGEVLTVEELLYAMLIGSGNDAANALAIHVSGSVTEFVKLMNEKAKQLGATNSNFVNANGIHDANHYTTANDLMIITQATIKYEIFNKICSTTSYTLRSTDVFKQTGDNERKFETSNLLLLNKATNVSTTNFYYQYATGIKTGYTSQARNCIIASAQKENLELLAVVLNVGSAENISRYLDAKNLFEYGFSKFKITPFNPTIEDIAIENSNVTLQVSINGPANILSDSELQLTGLTPKFDLKTGLQAPIYKDDIVGTISYEIDGHLYSFDLIAQNDIPEKPSAGAVFLGFLGMLWNIIKVILIILIAFIVIAVIIRLINNNRKQKRRAAKRYKN